MGGYAVASELVDLQGMAGTNIMLLYLYAWHLRARHKALKNHWGGIEEFRDAR